MVLPIMNRLGGHSSNSHKPIQIQGHSLQLSMNSAYHWCNGANLVLGATWLATLDTHIADYSALCIKFYSGDSFVTPALHNFTSQDFRIYDYTIEYKPDKDNLAADALSRSFFMVVLENCSCNYTGSVTSST